MLQGSSLPDRAMACRPESTRDRPRFQREIRRHDQEAGVPGRAIHPLHVRAHAADHRDARPVRDQLLPSGVFCDKHGDVRHDRRLAYRLFQSGIFHLRASVGESELDCGGLCGHGRDVDPDHDLERLDLSLERLVPGGGAVAQAHRRHAAALCVRRNGDLARPDAQPLAGRPGLRIGPGGRGLRLPGRAGAVEPGRRRVGHVAGRRPRRAGGVDFCPRMRRDRASPGPAVAGAALAAPAFGPGRGPRSACARAMRRRIPTGWCCPSPRARSRFHSMSS